MTVQAVPVQCAYDFFEFEHVFLYFGLDCLVSLSVSLVLETLLDLLSVSSLERVTLLVDGQERVQLLGMFLTEHRSGQLLLKDGRLFVATLFIQLKIIVSQHQI